jgi:phage baseplate assembly protein W
MPAFNSIPKRYSDIKIDLAAHPVSGDLALSINASAVKSSVRNLLLTGKYERFYQPYLGSGLQKYLFELVSPATAELIRESIAETIKNFEPRAKLISIEVKVRPDENSYQATVKFGILNLPDVVTVDQIIERIR